MRQTGVLQAPSSSCAPSSCQACFARQLPVACHRILAPDSTCSRVGSGHGPFLWPGTLLPAGSTSPSSPTLLGDWDPTLLTSAISLSFVRRSPSQVVWRVVCVDSRWHGDQHTRDLKLLKTQFAANRSQRVTESW